MARDTKGFYYGLKTLEQLLLRRDRENDDCRLRHRGLAGF